MAWQQGKPAPRRFCRFSHRYGESARARSGREDVWRCPCLPLIEFKVGGPHVACQWLRWTLSACFLDFNHYRCRVDFSLCLSARCGNVIKSRPESINPDCSLQSKRWSRPPVSTAQATYPHHVDGKDRKSTRLNSSHLGISYAV